MAVKAKADEKQAVVEAAAETANREGSGMASSEAASREDAEVKKKPVKEEFVEFALFKDNDKYSAPKFVGVNGKGYLIERGKMVRMPKSVFEILKNSDEQITYARRVMEELTQVEITVD